MERGKRLCTAKEKASVSSSEPASNVFTPKRVVRMDTVPTLRMLLLVAGVWQSAEKLKLMNSNNMH